MAESGKTGVAGWIAIVSGIVAVLAFLGFSNYEQIKRKLDPEYANKTACRIAHRYNDAYEKDSTSVSARTFAGGLREAIAATEYRELQEAFRTNISSLDTYAQVYDRANSWEGRLELAIQIKVDQLAWATLCTRYGVESA